jgi:hypothetical protein
MTANDEIVCIIFYWPGCLANIMHQPILLGNTCISLKSIGLKGKEVYYILWISMTAAASTDLTDSDVARQRSTKGIDVGVVRRQYERRSPCLYIVCHTM